ncbi:MAG: proline racemase family protein [Phycisphaerae bacterium]
MIPIKVVDSHTEGEPTRVVVKGGPDLGGGAVAAQAAVFRERFDWFRSAVVNEPRGCDALVGALIVPAADPAATCGVIFFNNVGLLNACGHGTIGLAATLVHLGRAAPGDTLTFETPVGLVRATPRADGEVEIRNVPSRRSRADVAVSFMFEGASCTVRGDIAWGGNWFFLSSDHGLDLSLANLDRLTAFSWAIRQALESSGIRGDDGGVIDHVELFGPPSRDDCDSRNFVLCPGKAYDRSPCGTGTSAKMACLHAAGHLQIGEPWRQESIIGSRFTGFIAGVERGHVLPVIRGSAFITAHATLHLDDRDPFRHGIRA